MLLNYGYDFYAMNDTERYQNVSSENLDNVKHLEMSMMGIGWPVKALFAYIFYFPFFLIFCSIVFFYKKCKNN